jgi:ribonuclease HI
VRIYTDGGCSGNPGPGGWAYVIETPSGTLKASGGNAATTNNRMELTAVIRALEAVQTGERPKESVRIHTDSRYVQKGITEWIHAWTRSGWTNSKGDPVKNRELWTRLLELTRELDPAWQWVRGHAGDALNEECDAMVRQEIRRLNRG